MSGKNYGPNVSGYLDPTGRNWEDVIFQAGKAILDRELNLGQDIDVGQAEMDLRRDLPSGWLSPEFLNNSPNDLALFASSPGANNLVLQNGLLANVNGWYFLVQHTNVINTNTVNLGAAPTGAGVQRTDLVFLEVWRILISPAPSTVGKSPGGLIWQQGNVATDPSNDLVLDYPDDIFDATLGVPSTLRVQLQCRLRVVQGVDIFSYPYGLDDTAVVANTVPPNAATPYGSATSYNYVNQSANGDPGLWVAGDGNPGNSLGTVDGFMYAIPLCAVFRRNSTVFSPYVNLNGAGVAFGGTSDRPDGLFNDAFVANDIADLRMAVSPSGWNYQEILDKNLTYLLDNVLRSEWTTLPYGGTVNGHSMMASSQVGISSPNGGTPPYSGSGTGGGPLVAQFDNVCRTFSSRPVFEVMTVAVPFPGGGWINGSVITINPTSLTVYPYGAFNWAAFAPANVQFVDVTRATWEGPGGAFPATRKRFGALTRNLVGTFSVSASATVPSTFNQTAIVAPGDTLLFASQPGVPYTVLSVGAGSVVLTAPYTGTSNTATTAFDVQRSPRIATITGVGTQPIGPLTITMGTIAPLGLTDETLYVDILVAYPPGSGFQSTPTADFQGTQQTFLVNNPAMLPPGLPISFDQTLLTSAPFAPAKYFNATPGLASLVFEHREAQMQYTTSQVSMDYIVLTLAANSEVVGATNITLPERVSSIIGVLRNGTPIVGTTALDTSKRTVTFTNSADYTNPGDTLQFTYIALRPFPKNGEQVSIFYQQRAPQAARSSILNNTLQVIPKAIPKQLYTLATGAASPGSAYPFPYAYVQTGGVFATAFNPGGLGENELGGESDISISDFNASTGMLALPIYVNYSPFPEQVSFTRSPTDIDSEGRSYFPVAQSGVYIPNAYAQDLSDTRRHKNFMAFLATLATNSPLGFTGELVLVLLTRWADNDEVNGVFFDSNNPSNNTTAASIFRLRNNMLTR